jgi:hypothetical protein
MNRILRALMAFAAAIGFVGCEMQATDSSVVAQHIEAAPVTMAIPVYPTARYDAAGNGIPPSWGFFGETDGSDGGSSIAYGEYYLPLTSVPVGATITQVKARVASGPFNGCDLRVWREPDFLHVDTTPLAISNVLGVNQVGTITANLNIPTQDLVQYFVTLHPTSAAVNIRCYVSAAQVTFTPSL